MSASWLKFSEMTWLRLLEGPGDQVILPVAPTMKRITWKGQRYNRMPDTRSTKRGCPDQGGAYLWDGWWDQKLAEIRAKQQEAA